MCSRTVHSQMLSVAFLHLQMPLLSHSHTHPLLTLPHRLINHILSTHTEREREKQQIPSYDPICAALSEQRQFQPDHFYAFTHADK